MSCLENPYLVHLPIHSSLEAFGVSVLIILSIYILKLRKPAFIFKNSPWISAGLVSMGVLDGFHAFINPGNNFVWLHSAATFSGGLLLAVAFSPFGHFTIFDEKYSLPLIAAVISALVGIISLIFPSLMPVMIEDGIFTAAAKNYNIVGGIFFIAASYWSIAAYKKNKAIEILIFSIFSFLLGLAGLVFNFSELWGFTWWLWHVLRFIACLIVLNFIFFLYQKVEDSLAGSEKKFRDFMLSANVSFAILDKKFNLREINNKALEIFPPGCTQMNLIGKNILEIAPNLERDGRYEKYAAVLQSGKSLSFDDVIPDKFFGDRHLTINSFKVGEGFGIIFSDITKRKQAEKEKAELEEQLRQTHKMDAIGTLAGGIAHDFNNILAIILGYAEMAYDEIKAKQYPLEYLDRITIAGRRAQELVRQILTFSRKTDQKKQPLMPSPVIDETLKMLRSSIPTTIKMVSNIDKECGIIMADPTNLHQIIMNLCANAQYAMEQKGTLSVKLFHRELKDNEIKGVNNQTGGPYIILSVADTGSGISEEAIKRIFDPFFTTKPVNSGTGLGLSVIHGIITDLNGFITVESKIGQGSTFKVYFPAIDNNHQEIAQPEPPKSLTSGDEKILVVDDEEGIIEVTEMMLGRLGYKTHGTTDSLKALELIRSEPNRFDLVITDQTMPELSGSELAKEIMKINPELPIIISSGYSSMMNEEKARAMGIRSFLLKPATKEELAHVVRTVLDGN